MITCNNGLRGTFTMVLDDSNGLWYFIGKEEKHSSNECVSAVTHNKTVENKLSSKSLTPYSSYVKMDINEAHQQLVHVEETAVR
jgi:hypothetical protein